MDQYGRKRDRWQDFKAEETHPKWIKIIPLSHYLRLCQPSTGAQGAESLWFLPAKSQTSLSALGNIVDRKLSRLKADSEIETARFRQAVYLNFTKKHRNHDPCGSEPGYQRIIMCFMEQLMLDHNSWSATVRRYVESINTIFKLRNFNPPADLSGRTNMCTKIVVAREKEECIAWQWSPITRKIYRDLLNQAKKSLVNSAETVVFDWFTLIRITGLRCARYAQKTQTNVEEHEYALGKHVIKAFVPSDWKFYNSKGRLVTDPMEVPTKLNLTFRIQKNRQNSQSITLVADNTHPEICPVRAAHRIYLRAKKLGQLDSEPMGIFINNFGIKKYLTGEKLQRYYDLSQRESIRTGLPRNWAAYHLTRAEFGPSYF